MIIEPNEKNKRKCVECGGFYVTNGDPSGWWVYGSPPVEGYTYPHPVEGKCEFCRPKSNTNKYGKER